MTRDAHILFDYTKAELAAGAFLIAGIAVLGYLSISIGGLRVGSGDAYDVRARFSNVGDLKPRAPVKIAGVTVGRVEAIRLADYLAEVQLRLDGGIALPKDTIASVATAGLLGDAYVALSPGGAEVNLAAGDLITHTEPALNVADIIGRAAFGETTAKPQPAEKEAP
jgi:phospholipid/cholesterol/gamma-HCH transport system substrate-binding protein